MWIDNEGKLFGKVNIIDFSVGAFVILAVVLLSIGVYKFKHQPPPALPSQEQIEAQAEAEYLSRLSKVAQLIEAETRALETESNYETAKRRHKKLFKK